jgi:GDP-D-mannose dehydratase
VRSRLADLLANPDAQANAETLRLIDAILKQQGSARFFSAGTSGAAGGSASSPR